MNPVLQPLLIGLITVVGLGICACIGVVIYFEVIVPFQVWYERKKQRRVEWKATKEFIKKL